MHLNSVKLQYEQLVNKMQDFASAYWHLSQSFPVAQMVEHGASNGKIMGSFPRESKSW